MKNQSRVQSPESRAGGERPVVRPSPLVSRLSAAFTLVEMLTTLALLSLIVLALMTIFNSTQNAFRASLTQTDVLESGRMAMNLIAGDLGAMTPSYGTNYGYGAVNFYANTNFGYAPLIQSLTASPTGAQRTNVVENFFVLSRQNIGGTQNWVSTGYAVVSNSLNGLYSLYRFSTNVPVMAADPAGLFWTNFYSIFLSAPTNYSHLMDGVVTLTVRPYDPKGFEMTNYYDVYNGQISTNQNTYFLTPGSGVVGFYMYSNTVPASVQVELGMMEDAVLQRAEGMSGAAQMNYLSNHVGQVHLFRQRVLVRNVDPSAYQ